MRTSSYKIIVFVLILITCFVALYHFFPLKHSINQKPDQPYDYYYIYAEEDGRELMRVPIAVSIDDELITEDNKRYRIVRVEENRGIARFVENVNIEQYKTK
ncbi:MAG TPA: stage II sporulation protein P [Firmicutes bacterium]|nr:stage II sporulation protein P [Bacillota bacterium]